MRDDGDPEAVHMATRKRFTHDVKGVVRRAHGTLGTHLIAPVGQLSCLPRLVPFALYAFHL